MKTKLALLLILSSITAANSAEFYNFNYKVKDAEDFPAILKQFVKTTSVITKSSPTISKTTERNLHIADWRMIEEGTVISLYIDKKDFDQEQFESYVLANKDIFNPVMKPKRANLDYATSVYYQASMGSFTQESPNIATIDYNQHSPITVGMRTGHRLNDKYIISGNVFYSNMKASIENIENTKVKIPAEYGLNAYVNYELDKPELTLFSGFDYENFYTFNMSELQNYRNVVMDETNAVYLTIGAKKFFTVFGNDLLAKASIAKSVATSTTSKSRDTETLEYDAMKFTFNADYQITDRFYLNSSFRYQMIEGSSELSSTKFAFGVGYVLF